MSSRSDCNISLTEFQREMIAGFERLDGKLDRLNEGLDEFDAALGRLEDGVARLHTEIGQLDEKLDGMEASLR
jgi:predicted nuclease with TOPRIM domain